MATGAQGRSVREIAEAVRLPSHLADHPYLVEYYGTVEWSVKAVYHGYLGWFRWAARGDSTRMTCGCC